MGDGGVRVRVARAQGNNEDNVVKGKSARCLRDRCDLKNPYWPEHLWNDAGSSHSTWAWCQCAVECCRVAPAPEAHDGRQVTAPTSTRVRLFVHIIINLKFNKADSA